MKIFLAAAFVVLINFTAGLSVPDAIEKDGPDMMMFPIPPDEEEDALEQLNLTKDYKSFLNEYSNIQNWSKIQGRTNNRPILIVLEDCVKVFAEYFGRKNNLRVHWSKVNLPEFKVSVGRISYDSPSRVVTKPNTVYVQWIHNGQSAQTIKGQMQKSIEKSSAYTWSKTHAFKLGINVNVKVGLPFIFENNINFQTEYSFQKVDSETTEEKKTFSISQEITASPKTSLKAEWIITELEMNIPWKVDVHFGGWIHIRFHDKYEGSYLWGFSMSYLRQLYSHIFQGGPLGLVYTTSGVFNGVKGTESVLKATEYPLLTSRSLSNLPPPLNVTILKKNILT